MLRTAVNHLALRALPRRGLAFSRAFSAQPALDVELPGMPALIPASAQPKPETKITTLSNGLRVASEETYGQVATIGMFIDAGSRYESYETNGVSHLIEHMAFKSTESRSHLRLVRDMEEIGATVGAASSRECIMFTAECLREDVSKATAALAETLLRPKLADWDIEAQMKVLSLELLALESNAQGLLTEILHSAGFGEGSALGRSLWCPTRNIGKLGAPQLKSFMKTYFMPKRMVLSAAGVNHDELVKLAEKYFTTEPNYATFTTSSSSSSSSTASSSEEYVGGEKLVTSNSDLTHLALAFNSGSWTSESLFDVCVLHFLLGGGGSFSAGGPGKGMHSRLYTNVLNKYHYVDSALAFNSVYNTSGLFGVYASSEGKFSGELMNIVAEEMMKLKQGDLSEEEVNRAKNQLKSSMLMRLESRQVLCEDIGRQVLTYGKRLTPAEVSSKIDAVSKASLKKAATKLLSSKPTIAAFGNVAAIPKYDNIAKKFK